MQLIATYKQKKRQLGYKYNTQLYKVKVWILDHFIGKDDIEEYCIFDSENDAIKFSNETVKSFLGDDGGEYKETLERETDLIKNGKLNKSKAFDYVVNTLYDGESLETAGQIIGSYNGTYSVLSDGKILIQTS